MIVTGNVVIDPKKLPKVEVGIFCRKIIPAIEEYLADPQHRSECDAWVAEYRRKKAREMKEDTQYDDLINA